jgi:predicted short-subunit dehydrogenase-like oxidoreductase (DUF2520 family)
MKVVIIGSGNVATVLGRKILSAGHEIVEVVSRSIEHAQSLATTLNTKASDNLTKVDTNADLYLLCIGDNAIEEVAARMPFSNKIVAHTAGAISKDVLRNAERFGVVYPLQSLRKEMQQLPEIRVLIDGNSPEVSKQLYDFAASWASEVAYSTDKERFSLHLAAVFASNFTNHIYALAEEFCKNEGVAFKHLLPLIKETASRLTFASPLALQTGPAVRNDNITIKKHLEVLSRYPELQSLYKQFTHSIKEQHQVIVK